MAGHLPRLRLPARSKRQSQDNTCLSSNVTYPSCDDVGNDEHSCYPNATTVIDQDTYTKLIWNVNLPQFTNPGHVDVYLFSDDSGDMVQKWEDQAAGEGQISGCANDSWLSPLGTAFNGQPLFWRFYYIIVAAGTQLTGAEPREPTFRVLQSNPLDSVRSQSSEAASSSSSVAASISSSLASKTPVSTAGATSPSGSLQGNNDGGSSFPNWAIALLSVLGFLSLLGFVLLAFVFCRDHRSRRRRRHAHRESMGSESPMMQHIPATSPSSPVMGTTAAGLASTRGGTRSTRGPRDRTSSAASPAQSTGDSGPFSGAEATFIADAFRNALRKPDFADRPLEEGESPDAAVKDPDSEVLLSRELAEEGRDIRSVRSERGVKVETLSDADDDRP